MVDADRMAGDLVEEQQDFFEGMKQLGFLFGFGEQTKSEIEQPAPVFLEEVALRFEIGGTGWVAFLTNQVGAMAVCGPGQVHDLAALDVVADCGHGSGKEDVGASTGGFVVEITDGEHAIDPVHEVFFLEFEHVHGQLAGEDFAA